VPNLTRRFFLKLGITSAALGILGSLIPRRWLPGRIPDPITPTEMAIVSRYIDILIPADDSPGALDLDVHKQLLSQAEHNAQLRDSLKQGCEWLDDQAQQHHASHYLALALDDQILLVAAAEQAEPGSVPQRFFTRLRDFSMQHYYSDARSWPQLGYQGPPQPRGFPDYQSPPSSDRT
jgi:Gluconate 2-dehydrogenase subunit 3